MKQKLFTLLTLALLVCSGAWADDVIFKMTGTNGVSGTEDTDYTVDGSTISVIHGKTLDISATFTNGTAQVKNGHSSKDNLSINTSTGVINIGNSGNSFVSITMTTGTIQEGDVITIDSYSDQKIKLGKVAGSTSEVTIPYTIPGGSGLIGSSTLYFLNKDIKSFSTITITRASSCTDVAAPTGLSCTAHTKNSLTFGWTAAEHASTYTATLYSDSECTSEVTSTSDIDGTTVTFSTLSGSTTYYCKVQSNGDGSTYCTEGGVTSAASGTTDDKDFTVTAVSNNDSWGTAASDAGSLDEDETATITATPAKGYEVKNWAVSGTGASITPSGDSHSLTTTLTMGTANATVTATFGLKDYTVTLDNQSATTAGTTSVTTNYNKNTNLTSSITCPTKTDYVFMGYYTAANGEGKRLIDGSGAWIASVDGYTDASKNWLNDGDVTLYACWMKYANSIDFNVYAYANLDREGSGTSTSNTFTYLDDNKYAYSLSGSTALDHSNSAAYIGLKFKTSGNYIKFAVEAGKQVTVIFGYVKTKVPTLSIDGGAETSISITKQSDNQVVYYAPALTDRLFKIKASDGDAMVIKKIFILDPAATVTATVGANGYTTFTTPYALDLTDANRPAGLKAYKATRDGASLSFVALNQTVPAGTGLLLFGEEYGPNYDIPVVEAAGAAATDNVMVGVTAATSMQSKADEYYYFVMKKAATAGDALAFAPLSTSSVTVPAGKAFVEVPNGDLTSSHELTFTFEEASGDVTGITSVAKPQTTNNASFYDLQGRRVAQPTKGLYIMNGKKVIVK